MRYLTIYKPAPERAGRPPTEQEMSTMGKLIEDMMKQGTLIMTEGLMPNAKTAKVRRSGSKYDVIDGPFSEAKELIGGFAVIEAKSLDHAKQLCEHFLSVAGDGESEILELYEPPGGRR